MAFFLPVHLVVNSYYGLWLYFYPFLYRRWIISCVCMFVWWDWFMYLPMIKLYFTFISSICNKLWTISHSLAILFIEYAHCMVTFQILTPVQSLYIFPLWCYRELLYIFFYLKDNEWMGSSVFYRGIRLGANLWLPGMMHIGVFRHFVSCILSQCPMAPISLCVLLWTSYRRHCVVTSWICVRSMSTMQNYASKRKKTTNSNSLKLTVQ